MFAKEYFWTHPDCYMGDNPDCQKPGCSGPDLCQECQEHEASVEALCTHQRLILCIACAEKLADLLHEVTK